MHRFVVIGPGRMGTALSLALKASGHEVLAAVHPSPSGATSRRYRDLTGVSVVAWDAVEEYVRAADVVLITVPDKAVTPVAQTLAERNWLDAEKVVVQTAGSKSSESLWPVRPSGAGQLTLHPLQTIADPADGPQLLRGVYCTLDGDEPSVALGASWVRAWGGIPVQIRPEQRAAYHAAAVLASNAVVALASVAAELSGIPDGLRALLPLLRGAVANLEQLGLPAALTGPIERGDTPTVEAHLSALRNNPTALSVYAALGKATADVARSKGSISLEQWENFHQMFQSVLGGMLCVQASDRTHILEHEEIRAKNCDGDSVRLPDRPAT
jgi:predicted short-subunit dehydrogenase-like oxidoreductase (DUF2520 family)